VTVPAGKHIVSEQIDVLHLVVERLERARFEYMLSG